MQDRGDLTIAGEARKWEVAAPFRQRCSLPLAVCELPHASSYIDFTTTVRPRGRQPTTGWAYKLRVGTYTREQGREHTQETTADGCLKNQLREQ